jgi:hypothetical protein
MSKYIIYTTYPRNFDPEIEGITLDSIAETCKGYINHSIPGGGKFTEIHLETKGDLDIDYIVGQLESELGSFNPQVKVVRKITEETS